MTATSTSTTATARPWPPIAPCVGCTLAEQLHGAGRRCPACAAVATERRLRREDDARAKGAVSRETLAAPTGV